jgi:hypothetical protein
MIDIDRMLADLDPATTTKPEVAVAHDLIAAGWPKVMKHREAAERFARHGWHLPHRNNGDWPEDITTLAGYIAKQIGG